MDNPVSATANSPQPLSKSPTWKAAVAKYQHPDKWKSIWQLANTFGGLVLFWFLAYFSLQINYLLTLLLAFPAAGFMVRTFIIQHDCGHGSFFRAKKWNDRVGLLCSLFSLTPYFYWQKSHAIHHANSGNLEHRGIGDVYTMTVKEYDSRSAWGKLRYRLYRNPIILFGFGATLLFTVLQRWPAYIDPAMKKVQASVFWTDLAILLNAGIMMWLFGWQQFLLVQLPVVFIACTTGVWLFYVQHQYEETYWAHDGEWDYAEAALHGSSFYKLPKILQWFTGNIGFHHIHHLAPRIPNYYLEECYKEHQMFQDVTTLTLRTSFRSMFLSLWDEDRRQLISFREYNRRAKQAQAQPVAGK